MGSLDSTRGGGSAWGIGGLMRRKQVDSVRSSPEGGRELAKALSVVQLIAIGRWDRSSLSLFFFGNMFYLKRLLCCWKFSFAC